MPIQIKNKRKPSKLFWRIVISAVGLALIFIAVSNFTLFFFGETATVSVTTRRVGGESDQYQPNQRYEWSVDYTFTDKNGAKFSGHTTRRGGDLPPKTESRAYYFSFAPFINALESEAQPNIGQLMFVIIGIFLLLVMNKKAIRLALFL
ncbi:MAG: hypothetical protein PHV32_04830 [Eubacteriales bacterium]|nr:hypothetical protein [Oscillospiraceae bacterium]MDD4493660.1 hypothetical protein [Eubacteriales bacterium]